MDNIKGRKVRFALAGAGIFASQKHLPALLACKELLEVVAVFSRSEESAKKLAALITTYANAPVAILIAHAEGRLLGRRILFTFDNLLMFSNHVDVYFGDKYEEMVTRADVDVVDLVLPIDLLLQHIETALRHGKHVLSEKPVAPSVQEGLDFISKYENEFLPKGLLWCIAENYFYEPAGMLAQELVQKRQSLGKIMVVSAFRLSSMTATNRYFHTAWRKVPSYQGGFVFDGGVHDVALLRLILGEIDTVYGNTAQFAEHLPPMDTAAATLTFASGAIGTLTICFNEPSHQVMEATQQPLITIIGTRGTLRVWLHRVELITTAETIDNPSSSTQVFTVPNFNMGLEAVTREVREFAKAVQSGLGAARVYLPRQALQDVCVIESMIESAKSKQMKSVPKVI